jgi:N-acetylmuramoyl-L-alanine amidase
MRFITIHASATFPSMDIGAAEITEWHLARGFRTIGYHEVIRRDGTVEIGRQAEEQGAHVGGFNPGNYGICLVGGLAQGTKRPENNYTDAQWDALRERMLIHHARWPQAIIMGHNGFPGHEPRGCPCFDWRKWREEFLASLHEIPVQLPSQWYDEVDAIP